MIIMIEISIKENVNMENNDGQSEKKIIECFEKSNHGLIFKKGSINSIFLLFFISRFS